MANQEVTQLKYSWLSANCGLKVSKMALGTGHFGKKYTKDPDMANILLSEEDSVALLDRFFELGGNFLDTSNKYSAGEAEAIIGRWHQARAIDRDRLVIATKMRLGTTDGNFSGNYTLCPNKVGLCRKSIMCNVEDSLKRLQTDYIDLYQIHAPDSGVPVEETLRAMDDLIRAGKIHYFGGCNMTGYELNKYSTLSEKFGLCSKMVTLQQQYNLLSRHSEWEVFEVCRDNGVGVLPWSPLKEGLLTGKFKRDTEVDANTRVGWATRSSRSGPYYPNWNNYKDNEKYWKIIGSLQELAQNKGKTVSQIALRWVYQRPCVTSVIGGARTIWQLESNMEAFSDTWSLTQAEMDTLNEVSAINVPYPYDIKPMLNTDRIRPLGQFPFK